MGQVNVSDVFTKIFGFGNAVTTQMVFLIVSEPPSVENIQANFADVEEGDHLFYKTPFGMNVHFYVASNSGNGKIKVYGRFCPDSDDPFIEQKFLLEQMSPSSLKLQKRDLDTATLEEPDHLKRWLHEDADNAKEMQRLEEYKTRKRLYGFLNNNSEHFITFVKTGKAQCEIAVEFKNALRRHIVAQGILTGNTEALKAAIKSDYLSGIMALLNNYYITIPAAKNKIDTAIKNSVETITVGNQSGIDSEALTKVLIFFPAEKNEAITTAVEGSVKATTAQTSNSVTLLQPVVKKYIKKIVVVQVTIEGAIFVVNMSMALYNYTNGHMSREEFKNCAVKQLISSFGSLAGGIIGSIAGCVVVERIGVMRESVAPTTSTIAGAAFGLFLGIAGSIVGIVVGRLTGDLINRLGNYRYLCNYPVLYFL